MEVDTETESETETETELDETELLLQKTTEITYAEKPIDTENLIEWGNALRKLATSASVEESKGLSKFTIWKLYKALLIDPKNHEALWCMGSALTSLSLLTIDRDSSESQLHSAYTYFQKAIHEDPGNQLYQKSIQEAAKAIESHQEAVASGASKLSYTELIQGFKSRKRAALHYDVCGWVVLAVSIMVFVSARFERANPPLPRLNHI